MTSKRQPSYFRAPARPSGLGESSSQFLPPTYSFSQVPRMTPTHWLGLCFGISAFQRGSD
jgi:hypothetical protein